MELIPDSVIPYDYSNVQTANLLFQLGETEKAKDISMKLGKDAEEFLAYYSREGNAPGNEVQKHMTIMTMISRMLKQNGMDEEASRLEAAFIEFYGIFNE